MEIGPGKYNGKHWQDGFLFVWEDALGMAEGIVAKHFVGYDHFGMNDIPRDIGQKITAEWRDIAARLEMMSIEQANVALNLKQSYRERLDGEITSHKAEIINMLQVLAEECDAFYKHDDFVCILGM